MKLNIISKGYFTSITEFSFLKEIGIGSFGKVQLALHIQTNKFYAVKIINLDRADLDDKEVMLLEREIYLHSEVDHPHIIKLWDTIANEKSIFLVMELAENSNLFSYQNKKKAIPQSQAFKYFSQTLSAIQYLHSLNIMHRDIKPQNILLDKNYNIKLCDLGWATEQIHQKRKTFCGTYEYMAPEMVFQKQYSYKIDVWALGVLLYELVHGYAPFRAKSLQEIKQKISKGYYEISSTISKELKKLIIDLLHFQPTSRPELSEVKNYLWIQKMKSQIFKEGENLRIELQACKQQRKQVKRQRPKQQSIESGIQKCPSKKTINNVSIKMCPSSVYKTKNTNSHKRVESIDASAEKTYYENRDKVQMKEDKFQPGKPQQRNELQKGQQKLFQFRNQGECSKNMLGLSLNDPNKKKKKCKTQGEQSLQKVQNENRKNMISTNKGLQLHTNSNNRSSFKKKTDKQNGYAYRSHMAKWSNFPEFSYYQPQSSNGHHNTSSNLTYNATAGMTKMESIRSLESMTNIKKISEKINQISQKIQKREKKQVRLKTHNFY